MTDRNDLADMAALEARIRRNLGAFPRTAISRPDLRQAAVAILVAPQAGVPAYALTRRAAGLRRSAGNYALPGGRSDAGESPEATALRETAEELGLRLDPGQVAGRLDDFQTLTGFVVTPVVVVSQSPLVFAPDPGEVASAWWNPLADLEHPEAPKREPHPEGGPDILRMPVRDRWINPPTAAFLYQFREVALHGRWTRVADIGQPTWTAR